MIRSLIAATLLMLASFSITSAQVNIQDSLALVALYDATNGDQWKNNSNWLFDPVSTLVRDHSTRRQSISHSPV
jgi:hypothetical protein